MHPVLTIFCAFTRPWAVDQWLEDLGKVEHDPALTNLCIIVDIDDPTIMHKIKNYTEAHNYRSFHCKLNEYWPNEMRLAIRRARIADVKNQSKDLVALTDGEYIIGLEDDTVFGHLPQVFISLIQPLIESPRVGFVEGVQVGRWGVPMVGAWKTNQGALRAPLTHIETLLPPTEPGYEHIDGGGFYGYATRRELYLNADYYTSTTQPWGPDVNYGLWLRSQDIECLVDWRLPFGHNDFHKIGYPDSEPLTKIVYTKNTINGKWDRQDRDGR